MTESDNANPIPDTAELPTTPAAPTVSNPPEAGDRSARTWSTRTLAAAAVAALVIGGGGGAALGAMSNGGDSNRGPGGRGTFGQFPGGQQGQQGQGRQGGPGMMPPQGAMPSTPPTATTRKN